MLTCPACGRFGALQWRALLKHMMTCKGRP